MFESIFNWRVNESAHFIYYYFPNSLAEKDINKIIDKRELAYDCISNFLSVQSPKKCKLYFLPDRNTAYALNIPVNVSFPHSSVASVIYNDSPFCREKIYYGHEIVHLLVFYWDKEWYHLEFLEEGLASYLDQSGIDKHYEYWKKLRNEFELNNIIDLSLDAEPIVNSVKYEKAASFVKYLIDTYGILKFRKLFVSSKINMKEKVFYINEEKLNKNFLSNLLQDVYKKIDSIKKEWLSNLGIKL